MEEFDENLNNENNLNSNQADYVEKLELELSKELPEDCILKFKRFTACKFKFDNDFEEKEGYSKFKEFKEQPVSRVKGCLNEWNSYFRCTQEFMWRYIDLKNYVAEIEGVPLPYNKKEIKRDLQKNLSKYNYGLNKF